MMSREQRQHFDVLVIGGGPAGQAAAVCAAESGVRVGIVDDNPSLGGQIWRAEAIDPQLDQKSNGQPDTPAAKWALRAPSRRSAGRTCSACGRLQRLSRTRVREARAGNGCAGAILALPRLDVAKRDGRRRSTGDGQGRSSDSRQACRGRRYRSVTLGGRGLSSKAWRADTDDLRASIVEQPGKIRHGARALAKQNSPGPSAKTRPRRRSTRREQ